MMILPRSQSSNFESIQDSKSKKFWKSLTSKERNSISIPKSLSTAKISSPIINESHYEYIPAQKQQQRSPNDIKRSSLMISEPRVSTVRKTSRMSRHLSEVDFSSLRKDENVTDPKELEFYNSILKRNSCLGTDSIIYESYDSDSENMENANFQMIESNETDTQADMLNSALEDYKLFINEDSDLESPNAPSFSFSDISEDLEEPTALNLLPAFSSNVSIESEVSIFKISNSLWVGSIILEDGTLDAFDDINTKDLFSELENETTKKVKSQRTSLLFF